MIFEGDQVVFEAIREKKALMKAGKAHNHIKPLIIFGGGLMKGAYGIGAALALDELGYVDVFSNAVGISSGAPTVAYLLEGSIRKGMRILPEDCCNPKFASAWRIWNQVDTEYLMDIIKNHEDKKIDPYAVLSRNTKIYFGVSEYKTGKPALIQPKTPEVFFDAMHASLTMQNVSRHKTYINGVHYADGGFTKPHVISKVIDEIHATHILFVTNNDRDFGSISNVEKIMNRTIFRLRLNGAFVTAINARREERDKAIDKMHKVPIPAGIVWGDGSISSLEKNPEKISAAVEMSRVWWHGFLGE